MRGTQRENVPVGRQYYFFINDKMHKLF